MPLTLRIFCSVLVVLICSAFGFSRANQYKRRTKELACCETLFVQIKTCLTASQMPTKDLFERLSTIKSLAPIPFVSAVGTRLFTETDFPKIWAEEIEKAKPSLSLKKDDYQPLLSLCELIGSCDTGGILEGVDLARSQLNLLELEANSENNNNGNLSRSLGVLSGIATAILIL